mgnify:CR=1 FL=1
MKHTLTLSALVFATSCYAQTPDYVPADGLVAWYPFDGSLIDASGMVGEGVASGTSFGLDRWSNEGSALQVVSGSFANLGMQDQLTLSPEDNLTIAMWSHPDSQENLSVTKYQNGNGSGSSWFVQDGFDSGVRVFGNGTSGTPNEDEWYQTCPNVTDGWSHVVVVFEGGSVTLRVDGTLICQTTMPVSTSTQSQPVLVGRSNCTNGSNCNHSEGRIDDLGFWNRALSSEEALQLFLGAEAVYGCMDSEACNFNPGANVNDGSCYSCEIPSAHCGEGTYWDTESQSCVIANPSDTDFDGCVSMTDLLDLLSVFGTCNEIPWSCGDPLEYQGYDYETVQVGEQCWFAENCRYLPAVSPSSNGSEIDGNAHAYVFEYEGQDIQEAHALENFESYGVLYNRVAMQTWDVCPAGWHVPTDSNISGQGEFWELIAQFVETEVAVELKSDFSSTPGWNGSNNSGFDALPAGYRRVHSTQGYGFFGGLGVETQYWAVETWSRRLTTTDPNLSFMGTSEHWGLSVRCIQDSE